MEGRIPHEGHPIIGKQSAYSNRIIFLTEYSLKHILCLVGWHVIGTAEFEGWFESLDPDETDSVIAAVDLLVEYGPTLKFPRSSDIKGSKFGQMRELRIQHQGRPLRVLYAFDPRRSAVLILGGDKTGDDRWYETHVPKADAIFEAYLRREGLS
jgi:hypothetical protein